MTYTYDPAALASDDVSLVRFHIGDNHDEGHYLENEEIQYWITASSVEEAVIACIRYIITQLSSPNFKKDWLSVTNHEARVGFEKILDAKQEEFGLSSGLIATSSISLPRRADSYSSSDDTVDGAP